MLRIVVMSDFHFGSMFGAILPEFNPKIGKNDILAIAREDCFYHHILKKVNSLGTIDYLIANGDLVEGKGLKDSSNGLIINDISDQIHIAYLALKSISAKNVFIIGGTPYHVMNHADYEKAIAHQLNTEVYSEAQMVIKGVRFNFRHHISTSVSPMGIATPLVKEIVANTMKDAAQGKVYKKNIYVFSHTHHYSVVADDTNIAMTSPALQLSGGVLSRRNTKVLHYGFLEFLIDDKEITWKAHLLDIKDTNSKLSLVV